MTMGKNCRDFETHDFYCINCGKKSIPIVRMGNQKKAAGHRKVMYCPSCRQTVNHIECRDQEEVATFKEEFENGVYVNEAKDELRYAQEHPPLSALCNGGRPGLR